MFTSQTLPEKQKVKMTSQFSVLKSEAQAAVTKLHGALYDREGGVVRTVNLSTPSTTAAERKHRD